MTGTTLSHYRIVGELGRGGMGVVYKAEDTRLERTVALKLLAPHMLASESDRNRFYREARAAAALHHPHIATVFEIDETEDGRPFIAMEFIEGQTLEDRIGEGPLPLEQITRIGIQIAEALQAAHDTQIVHRDVKSANVMLTTDGRAKVLDFGLAKTKASTKLTQLGSTLGTVAYMSPEQALGEEVDHRSDLWSLGVVLYEMTAGRVPFAGDYEQAVVYSILNGEPHPLTAIRTGVPMELEQIVDKCLRKDADLRYPGAAGVIADLKALQRGASGASGVSRPRAAAASAAGRSVAPAAKQRTPKWLWAALAGALLVGAAGAWMTKPDPELPARTPVHARIQLEGVAIDDSPALSDDGSLLAFKGSALTGPEEGVYQLDLARNYLRLVAEGRFMRPRYTADGRWLLLSGRNWIGRVPIAGGAPVRIGDFWGRPVSVGPNDFLGGRDGATYRVPLDGGEPTVVFAPDTARGYTAVGPSGALGDGKRFLLNLSRGVSDADVGIGRIGDGSYEPLLPNAHSAEYVRSGHLVYIQGNEWSGPLMARPFDPERETFTGAAVQVLGDDVNLFEFDVAPTGTLVYRLGLDAMLERRLFWYSTSGERLEELPADPRDYLSPAVSPDGSQIAFVSKTETASIDGVWVIDAKTGNSSQLSFANSNRPAWSADGRFVLYNEDREGEHWDRRSLMRRPADGSGVAEHVLGEDVAGQYLSMSPAGDWWVFTVDMEIILVPTGDPTQRRSLDLKGWEPTIAPNGQYVAFGTWADEKNQIYVQGVEGEAFWPVSESSDSGACCAAWSADGRWLYYQTETDLKRAAITYEPTFRRALPQTVMPLSREKEFALHPDGERILIVEGPSRVEDAHYVDAILNFDAYLRQIAPPDE